MPGSPTSRSEQNDRPVLGGSNLVRRVGRCAAVLRATAPGAAMAAPSTERLWTPGSKDYRGQMAPRIEPRVPQSIETIISRELRQKGISRTHYFETAAAFLAGYRARQRDDVAELEQLSEQIADLEPRLDAIESYLHLRP